MFTNGTGPTLTPAGVSSLATSPNEGSVATTPFRITPIGTDQQQKSVSIPAIQAGNQYVATITIPLPLLPGNTSNQSPNGPGSTPKAPATSYPQDQLIFRASMTVKNLLPGLSVARFTAVPQARSGGQVYNGPQLPPGQSYSSFQVFCQVTFAASTTTSAGAVTISTEGTLTRQAGGAAT